MAAATLAILANYRRGGLFTHPENGARTGDKAPKGNNQATARLPNVIRRGSIGGRREPATTNQPNQTPL